MLKQKFACFPYESLILVILCVPLCVCADELPSDPLQSRYDSWLCLVDHLKIKAFVNLTLADSVRHGVQNLLFISGFGRWLYLYCCRIRSCLSLSSSYGSISNIIHNFIIHIFLIQNTLDTSL